jgi:hypothetical protein
MTKRERYLKALRNEKVDGLIWVPNFDYWYQVNKARGTLPEAYRDLSRNDLVRAIDATIWNRVNGLKTIRDASVKESWHVQSDHSIHLFETPVGTIREIYRQTEDAHSSKALTEHFIKDLDTIRTMQYVVEATAYEPDYAPVYQALSETGDDGVVLHMSLCVPFIQFSKTDAGYLNGYYLWVDHREEVDALIQAYFDLFLDGYRILADGPADMISTGDNMDGTMFSPDLFREYAIPFYQESAKIISAKGKIFSGHWCGRTQSLLDQVPGCGLDLVEAIVTQPMADLTLEHALDLLKGKVVLQGGIPAVLVCAEGGARDDFERYFRDVILPLKERQGFILGMSDNVPPNADFARVAAVSALIGSVSGA